MNQVEQLEKSLREIVVQGTCGISVDIAKKALGVLEPVPVKQFLLFHGENHEAQGGFLDDHASYDSVEEAKRELGALNQRHFWWHIVDLQTGAIVASSAEAR